jgi:hypothetical protein
MDDLLSLDAASRCLSCGKRISAINRARFDRCEWCDRDDPQPTCSACGNEGVTVTRGSMRLCACCDASLAEHYSGQQAHIAKVRRDIDAKIERDHRMNAARAAMRAVVKARDKRWREEA